VIPLRSVADSAVILLLQSNIRADQEAKNPNNLEACDWISEVSISSLPTSITIRYDRLDND